VSLQRAIGELIVRPDAVYFPMADPSGTTLYCRVTFNALALKSRCPTFLSDEEAMQIFVEHREEIETAASHQHDLGVRFVTVGAAELAP
jgi:hypothetical protein